MADDAELASDAEVLPEDGLDIGLDLEEASEVLEAKDLEVADEAEEDADEEEDGGAVEPGEKLQRARHGVAQVDAAQERDPRRAGGVPPYLVRALRSEAGQHEDQNDLQGSLQSKTDDIYIAWTTVAVTRNYVD